MAAMGLVLAVALAPSVAQARIVQPGGNIDGLTDPLTGVSLAERPELTGQVIADLLVPFSNGTSFDGTVRTQVVREDVAGTLDFYYTVSPANDSVHISGFDHFLTDVDWRDDLGKGASGVFRSPDGDTLFLSFNSGGATFVKTNATAFARTGRFVAIPDSGEPAPPEVAVFAPAPASPIPLPPAVFAAPIGFAFAALASRRLRARLR
jgi:hypothetical protein